MSSAAAEGQVPRASAITRAPSRRTSRSVRDCERDRGLGIDPQEATAAAEVTERARRVVRSRPVWVFAGLGAPGRVPSRSARTARRREGLRRGPGNCASSPSRRESRPASASTRWSSRGTWIRDVSGNLKACERVSPCSSESPRPPRSRARTASRPPERHVPRRARSRCSSRCVSRPAWRWARLRRTAGPRRARAGGAASNQVGPPDPRASRSPLRRRRAPRPQSRASSRRPSEAALEVAVRAFRAVGVHHCDRRVTARPTVHLP